MDNDKLKQILEGALLAAGRPLDIGRMEMLFDLGEAPPRDQIRAVLEEIEDGCKGRGFELSKTGSGYRFQVRQELSDWVNRLWEEKPQKYSRALLETLALIAYRQPITRGDIEEIRGVSVSSQIIKTLQEREWVRVVGHRDVPGRPALYATTRQFLDYFDLQSLNDLPPLSEIKDIDEINPDMSLPLDGSIDDRVEGDSTAVSSGESEPELPESERSEPEDSSLVEELRRSQLANLGETADDHIEERSVNE